MDGYYSFYPHTNFSWGTSSNVVKYEKFNNNNKITIDIPTFSCVIYFAYTLSGKITPKIFDPSRGGIGIKLNNPRPIFINPKYKRNFIIIYTIVTELNLYNKTYKNNDSIATMKFVKGPANETKAIPSFGFLKNMGVILTGFAYPTLKKTKHIRPNKSKCFKGFNDNLPSSFAVGSPSQYAIYP